MAETIFSKIISGDIPCHKVYEDDQTLAFMDIHPVQPGMVLVIAKRPAEDFTELTDDEMAALMKTVKKIANKLKQVFPDKRRIALQLEGLDVPHVHAKVFPINSGDDFRALPDFSQEADHDELARMAQKLTI